MLDLLPSMFYFIILKKKYYLSFIKRAAQTNAVLVVQASWNIKDNELKYILTLSSPPSRPLPLTPSLQD